jgi:thiamine pyrophosphokinase
MNPIYIFGSGQKEPDDFYLSFFQQKAYIISIDGGADLLKELKVIPDLALGDFDSITKSAFEWLQFHSVKKIQYPCEKDFSDFELVCQQLISDFSPTQIDLFCMQGGRSDHFLFNLLMAEVLLDNGFQCIFHSTFETIYFIDTTHPIRQKGRISESISIVPINNSVLIHHTKGLKYSLWEDRLYRNQTRGLSNELIKDEYEVSVSEGKVMLIHTRRK